MNSDIDVRVGIYVKVKKYDDTIMHDWDDEMFKWQEVKCRVTAVPQYCEEEHESLDEFLKNAEWELERCDTNGRYSSWFYHEFEKLTTGEWDD